MPDFTIRHRSPEDLSACASVLARVYHKDGYPVQGVSHAVEFLSNSSTLCAWAAVSVSDGAIIGHVAMSSAAEKDDVAVKLWRQLHDRIDDIAVLERLFVDPEARGRGVADALMQAVVEDCRARGLRVVLFALEKDQGAMRLYEKVGWARFGTQRYCYGDGESMEAVCYVSPALVTSDRPAMTGAESEQGHE